MIVVDTSIIVAYMNASDDHHPSVTAWLDRIDDDLATTPLILAEVDHLVSTRGGPAAMEALRADLVAGAYLIEWWTGAVQSMVAVAERYHDFEIGLADASLVALADHLGVIDIGTLDERHFRLLRPLSGEKSFRLLPADS